MNAWTIILFCKTSCLIKDILVERRQSWCCQRYRGYSLFNLHRNVSRMLRAFFKSFHVVAICWSSWKSWAKIWKWNFVCVLVRGNICIRQTSLIPPLGAPNGISPQSCTNYTHTPNHMNDFRLPKSILASVYTASSSNRNQHRRDREGERIKNRRTFRLVILPRNDSFVCANTDNGSEREQSENIKCKCNIKTLSCVFTPTYTQQHCQQYNGTIYLKLNFAALCTHI